MTEDAGNELRELIGQRLIIGFQGLTVDDPGTRRALEYSEQGLIAGVVLFRYNIESPEQLSGLLAEFHKIESPYPVLTLVDQEGGKVQRLAASNGFEDFPSAKAIAVEGGPEGAEAVYSQMANMLRSSGVNINFGPCVDLDCEPNCEVIGGLERSYSENPELVTQYASSFIKAFRSAGVLTCCKHFPGHGRASGDSHKGMVDITETWSEEELLPYRQLNESGELDTVMTAHLIHNRFDEGVPATLSDFWLRKLREDIGFSGVTVSDDLHMGAIQQHFSLEQLLKRALSIDLDLLLFSNNPAAAVNVEGFEPDPDLPLKVERIAAGLLEKGEITIQQLRNSAQRVRTLRDTIRQ